MRIEQIKEKKQFIPVVITITSEKELREVYSIIDDYVGEYDDFSKEIIDLLERFMEKVETA